VLKIRMTVSVLAALAIALMLATGTFAAKPKDAPKPKHFKATDTIAGVLSCKAVSHDGGNFLDIRIQGATETYGISGSFLDQIKTVGEAAKKLVGKHVVAKGELAEKPKTAGAPHYLMVNGMEDITEQKPVDLAGAVKVEVEKGPKGDTVAHFTLTVGDKVYEAVTTQAKDMLGSKKGKNVTASCYLDGDEKCLRISEIATIKADAAK